MIRFFIGQKRTREYTGGETYVSVSLPARDADPGLPGSRWVIRRRMRIQRCER
jgi:hypothetical protein